MQKIPKFIFRKVVQLCNKNPVQAKILYFCTNHSVEMFRKCQLGIESYINAILENSVILLADIQRRLVKTTCIQLIVKIRIYYKYQL
jgi:hypothetical protein